MKIEPLGFVAEPVFAAEETDNDGERLVLAIAQDHWVDAEGSSIGWQRTGT